MTIRRYNEYPYPHDIKDNIIRDYLIKLYEALQNEGMERIRDFDILKLNNVPWVDIREYGADEGLSDNSKAIQAAIDSGKPVLIPKGTFSYETTLTVDTDRTFIKGLGLNSRLHYTGSSYAIKLDAVKNSILESFLLQGNSNATNGIVLAYNSTLGRGCTRNNKVSDIDIIGFSKTGAWSLYVDRASWQNYFENINILDSNNVLGEGSVRPYNGIFVNKGSDNNTFVHVVVQDCSGSSTTSVEMNGLGEGGSESVPDAGIVVLGSGQNNFYGGKVEFNSGWGMVLWGAFSSLLSGIYFERNSLGHIRLEPTSTLSYYPDNNELASLYLNSGPAGSQSDYAVYMRYADYTILRNLRIRNTYDTAELDISNCSHIIKSGIYSDDNPIDAFIISDDKLAVGTEDTSYKTNLKGRVGFRNSDDDNSSRIYNSGASGAGKAELSFETGSGLALTIDKDGKAKFESLKTAQSHPANYAQVYVNTDTGEIYRV